MSADQSLAYSRLSATKETSVPIGVWSSGTKDAPHPRGRQIDEWGQWSPGSSAAGFLLMDASLTPVSYNSETVEILGYPNTISECDTARGIERKDSHRIAQQAGLK